MKDIPAPKNETTEPNRWADIAVEAQEKLPRASGNVKLAAKEFDSGFELIATSGSEQTELVKVSDADSGEGSFPMDGNDAEKFEAIKTAKRPVDYKKLIGDSNRVAVFGEEHTGNSGRRHLSERMHQFKERGVTHLGLEALPSSRQGLLDDYFEDKASREEVLQALKTDWGWHPESYMRLIDSAKSQGIRTVGLNKIVPPEQADKWFDEGKFGEEEYVREENFHEKVAGVLNGDPKAKMLVLAGNVHTGINPDSPRNFTSLAKKSGFNPVSILLQTYDRVGDEGFRMNIFQQAAARAGIEHSLFSYPLSDEPGSSLPAHHVINVPQPEADYRQQKNDYELPMRYRFELEKEPKFEIEEKPRAE